MKKIALFALMSTAMAAPAMAESSDVATINLTGTVQQICTVVPNPGLAGGNAGATTPYSVSGDDVTTSWTFLINNTLDPTQATIGDTSQRFFSVGFNTFCNDNFTWSTQATNGAMINGDGSAPAGFTGILDYNVAIKQLGTGAAPQLNGQNFAAGQTIDFASDAFQGTSQLDISVGASSTPPVAGDYVETLTLTFQADA
ncbi:hypothetical protein J3454_08620 [Erythrobacter sp. NFXS35]|uniref:hypothetical protein n=1 Tax=Erythrobacter sp. NFXS35 TaxID=2818436 RepID=UPI0032DFE28D